MTLALLALALPSVAGAKDSDRDGLPNSWEKGTSHKSMHLPALGADPRHKDIFVELDYSQGAKSGVSCSDLNALYTAFRTAPVSNPDGKKGIHLHLDAGKTCSSRKYSSGGSGALNVPPGCTDTSQGFNALNSSGFSSRRIHVFHHAGVVTSFCGSGGEAGVATEFGADLIVATQNGNFAHVFMHELGHNLGLDHPEGTFVNHLSVMGRVPETSTDGNTPHQLLDYQRFPTPALDENALSEPNGLGTPLAHKFFEIWVCPAGSNHTGNSANPVLVSSWPGDANVDWNCTGDQFYPGLPGSMSGVDPGTVSADINGDGNFTVIPGEPNEWKILAYRSGGQVGP